MVTNGSKDPVLLLCRAVLQAGQQGPRATTLGDNGQPHPGRQGSSSVDEPKEQAQEGLKSGREAKKAARR